VEFFYAIALAGLTAWLIANFGLLSFDRTGGAFAALIGGWRGDGWPRGVQEEDRDRPWGHGASTHAPGDDDETEPRALPNLTPLRPHIRGR
jgi:hypothetical protein